MFANIANIANIVNIVSIVNIANTVSMCVGAPVYVCMCVVRMCVVCAYNKTRVYTIQS
jgi:hypothetical protein